MRIIELSIRGDSWVAKDSDPRVKELFGTDTLPTAFRAAASLENVVREITKLNPDAVVRVVV